MVALWILGILLLLIILLLFRGSRSRSELVATFMAVLELCRNNLIRLAGSASDCTVTCDGDVPEELT